MTDALDQSWKPSPDAFFIAVADETVLLHVRRSIYYGLNPLGTRIWDGLNAGKAPRELCREIADEFDVSVAEVEHDARQFLEDLRHNEIALGE